MREPAPEKAGARRFIQPPGTPKALANDAARYANGVAYYGTSLRCAGCGCCAGYGWNLAGTYFDCAREHHDVFDFAGLVLVECPHCAETHDPVIGFARTFASQLDADLHVAGQWFAMRAVGVHFDVDGVHRGERRQQRALDRLRESRSQADTLKAVA